jgi:hypothetical protein
MAIYRLQHVDIQIEGITLDDHGSLSLLDQAMRMALDGGSGTITIGAAKATVHTSATVSRPAAVAPADF